MISNEIAIGLLIALGAGIMFLSILRTRQVLWLLKGSKYAHGWRILFSLMIFFLVGYVATLALVLAGITEILVILTGVIFFFGALFVYLVVRMGYLTIDDFLRTTVSKDYWETTFNAMQDAVALVDRDHRIVQANQALVDIAPGRSPQIVGQTYYTALSGATCPEADCPLEQTMQRGQPAKCVHEYGKRIFEAGQQIYYIALEHIKGISLKEYKKKSGPMPIKDFVPILNYVGSALNYLHTKRLIHLDIKPANILKTKFLLKI